jgi:hypothetical protein
MTMKGGCFSFPEKGETVMKETGYYKSIVTYSFFAVMSTWQHSHTFLLLVHVIGSVKSKHYCR